MMYQQKFDQAVVIGGSIAGLLAARILSDHCQQVTILEKDNLYNAPGPRKGTPQSPQLHGLHQGGANVIHSLFPGLDLNNIPSVLPCDLGGETRWFFQGQWMPRFQSHVRMYWCDRHGFEYMIRQLVAALPNVKIESGYRVMELVQGEENGRLLGIAVRQAGSEQQLITADLIIDASGRGSRLPQWLNKLGYGKPHESTVKIDMGYAGCTYQLPPDVVPPWKALMIAAEAGVCSRMGVLQRLPNNQLKLAFAAWFGQQLPAEESEMIAFARSLAHPEIATWLEKAVPVTSVQHHKLPSNRWRHYEKLARWPENLMVLGDAVCSFNPTYGQGMTVVAQQAAALGDLLQQMEQGGLAPEALTRQFQKEVARVTENPWMVTTGEDLRFPEAEGERPLPARVVQGYMGRVLAVAQQDTKILHRFLEVMSFLREPTAMFAPEVILAVIKFHLRQSSQRWLRRKEAYVPSPTG
ncbi:MAG: FAD-dependent monooxygenase [Chloroflexota bacterium]